MKFLSDNVLVLMLTMVLGLTPLQNIVASVSGCVSMGDTMHHQMSMSDSIMQHNMGQTSTEDDCCNKNSCDMTHCSSAFTAVMTSNNLNDMTYTVTNIQLKPSISLLQFYPSSLYRPPKV